MKEQPRKRLPSLYAVSVAALVFSAAVIVVLLWQAARSPVSFTATTPMKVLTPRVRAGHSVTVQLEYCKDGDDIAATFGAVLARRGVFVPLNLWPSDLPVGCHSVALTLPIPAYVSENRYVLYLIREYRPTMFGGVSGVSIQSEPFEILGYDGSPPAPLPFKPQYEDPKFDHNQGQPRDPWGR